MRYANWLTRVLAYLIDGLVILPFYLVAEVFENRSGYEFLYVALLFVGLVLSGYNRWFLAGRTGQSWGRKVARIRLVNGGTGQPIGPVKAFVRDVAHLLDDLTFYVGYLLPLWTARRQTIADKVMSTVVVR